MQSADSEKNTEHLATECTENTQQDWLIGQAIICEQFYVKDRATKINTF